MDFEVDHPTISLSLGKSVVPAGASIPVVSSGGGEGGGVMGAGSDNRSNGYAVAVADAPTGAAAGAIEEATLTRLRVYVEATRRMELCLDKISSAMAEEDFVKTRQQGQEVTVSFFLLY